MPHLLCLFLIGLALHLVACAARDEQAWRSDSAVIAITEPAALQRALDHALDWFEVEMSHRWFPVGGIDHDEARAAAYALRHLLEQHRDDSRALHAAIEREFEPLRHATHGSGDTPVLFTGYYAPEFRGSLRADDVFRHPLYRLPSDDRRELTRHEIETTGELDDLAIIWLADRFDAYVAHVNGSARMRLPDGTFINVAHSATNEREYTSIGRLLIDDGEIAAEAMSLDAIRRWFERHPERFEAYAHRNDRYVFFENTTEDGWPRGLDKVPLTAMASVAIDPEVYPPGMPLLVDTGLASDDPARPATMLRTIMIAQDRGGAIRGPNRVDLFIGVGEPAGSIAGRQIAPGRLRLLRLRSRTLEHWRERSARLTQPCPSSD